MKIMWTILLVALMSNVASNATPVLRLNNSKPTDNYKPIDNKIKIFREAKPNDNYKPTNDKK
jgi:hypothetical protein